MSRRRELTHIDSLFGRYRATLIPPQKTVETTVCEVVKELCGFVLDSRQVQYQVSQKTVFLKIPSVLKQELLSHKDSISRELFVRLGSQVVGVEVR